METEAEHTENVIKDKMIKNQWDVFKKEVMPKNASEIQVNEMKKAFYCGVLSSVFILEEIGANDKITLEEGVDIIESINKECHEFILSLKNIKGENDELQANSN